MIGYIVRRIFLMIPTLLMISLIVFIIIQLPPGDYLTTYINELQSQGEAADQGKIAFLRTQADTRHFFATARAFPEMKRFVEAHMDFAGGAIRSHVEQQPFR